MAEYVPIKNSNSLATSTSESNESRVDDDLIEIEDFASFKGYTSEMENLLVTFNLTQSIYRLDEPIVAHFYTVSSSFEMKPDDMVVICPMRKSVPFVKVPISQCLVEPNPQAVSDEIFDESLIVAKKAVFTINELPTDVAKEYYFQFCYLNAINDVIGISTPFRFHKDGDKDIIPSIELSQTSTQLENIGENYDSMLMEKRDDDDFIVVRSQESFLKERVEHLTKSNTLLEYLIRSLEKDLSNKTIELQKLFNKLEDEKVIFSKTEQEKNQALSDFEDISQKYFELQRSMVELKQLIEKEEIVNKQLQAELNDSKIKILKLEDTFMNIQTDEEELKKILKDKEEEISFYKDMVANLEQIKDELTKKVIAADDRVQNLQSSLANALNERRILMHEKNKYNDYDVLIDENKVIKQRVSDLEAIKEKQANEIKTLEDELRNSVANFNNLDAKFQTERNANAIKEQKNALTLDKTKFELIEMHARLEQSRVEYANLYRKYRALQKVDRSKIEKASTSMSRSNSISSNVSLSTSLHVAKDNKMDDIDLRLQQLEEEGKKEEDRLKETEMAKSVANLSVNSSTPQNESLLIEIDSDQVQQSQTIPTAPEANEVRVEANTSAKTIISADNPSTSKANSVVTIPCIMCDKSIECRQHEDGSGQMHEMVNHLETEHKQKMCPVCSTLFDTRLPIFSTYFANHIQNHFNNIKYPSLNSN